MSDILPARGVAFPRLILSSIPWMKASRGRGRMSTRSLATRRLQNRTVQRRAPIWVSRRHDWRGFPQEPQEFQVSKGKAFD